MIHGGPSISVLGKVRYRYVKELIQADGDRALCNS